MYSRYSVAATVCSVVFPILASIAVISRLWARKAQALRYGPDDYVVVFALCLTIALCCITIYSSCRANFGRPVSTMTPHDLIIFQKYLYFQAIVAYASIGVIKLSVLLFYKRIFQTRRFKIAANIVMLLVTCWTLGALFAHIFSVWPIYKFWESNGGPSRLRDINYGVFQVTMAATDIVLDITVLCLPLPVIGNLHMSQHRKFTITGIFWLGIFCVIAASVRLHYCVLLNKFEHVRVISNKEYSYVTVSQAIWAEVEPCCSIIAACLPSLGPLAKEGRFLHSMMRSLRSLTLRSSKTGLNAADQGSSSSEGLSNGAWHKIQPDANSASYAQDIELQGRDLAVTDSKGILVEKSFTSTMAS